MGSQHHYSLTQEKPMKTIKVLFDFATFTIPIKVTFFRNIILKLTNNPYFLTCDPTLADLKIAVDALEAAIYAAKDGGHTPISAMHDKEKIVTVMFKNLAHNIDKTANGDETKLLSSGFNLTNQPALNDKAVLSATDGHRSGTMKLTAKAKPKAGAYIWQKHPGNLPLSESTWETITTTTQASYLVEDLPPGTYWYFRYAAVTPDEGVTDFCQPILKLVN